MDSQTCHTTRKLIANRTLASWIVLCLASIFSLLIASEATNQATAQTTFDPLGRSIVPQPQGIVAPGIIPPQGGTINALGLGPVQRGQTYQGPQIQPRINRGPLGPAFTPQFSTPPTLPPQQLPQLTAQQQYQLFQQQQLAAQQQQPFVTPQYNPRIQTPAAPAGFSSDPAFASAPTPAPCGASGFGTGNKAVKKRHFIPKIDGYKTPGQNGQIMMTPSRIIAPVGSEVVALAGICGEDGYFVVNQPLEFMLSNDSVGQMIEVGGMNHPAFNKVVPPTAKKFDGQYAMGRTGLKPLVLTRGTPTPCDDIRLLKGQTFVSVSSESPGTTYLTGVAPNSEGWDRRRTSTRIYWVDGNWAIPTPFQATAGTVAPLKTLVTRSDGTGGIEGWKVRYAIVGGAPAEFAPAGSQTSETTTNKNGEGIVQIRQRAGQFEPGVTQVRVDVVRPPTAGEAELIVESGITSVTWSAPALTIRAIGPADAGADEPFNYRIEVTNPGDQLAREVVVTTKDFDPGIEYISSSPKPTQYGSQYQWDLGDIAPGSQPRVIDLQLKTKKRGTVGMCFEVASESDRLRTEACAQTEITAACIGLEVEGPETARVGDEIVYNIGIVNQCDEPLRNIRLRIAPDPGLVAVGTSSNIIEATIVELGFGERRDLPVGFQVIQTGRQCFKLDIVADGGHDAGLLECVIVSQDGAPSVRLQLQGGDPIRVGETARVNAIVSNIGNVPLNAVSVVNEFAGSLEPVAVSPNVKWTLADAPGSPLILDVGRLEPGDETLIALEYTGEQVDGNADMIFTVSSAEAATDTQEINIRIGPGSNDDNRGLDPQRPIFNTPTVPGSDLPPQPDMETTPRIPDDPLTGGAGRLGVQVQAMNPTLSLAGGDEGLIRFRVTNNDSFNHENVNISFVLPPGLTYRGVDTRGTGLTVATQEFADVREVKLNTKLLLRRGEALDFTVGVQGKQIGQSVFEVLAESNQTESPTIQKTSVNVLP